MTGRRFASLDTLLRPRSVAVIGASADPVRIGGRPIRYMLERGFAGRIMPVNPNRAEVQGLPAWGSVAALPEVPDTAIVAVPGALAIDAVEQLGARGVRSAIVFTAGFAEMGEAGAAQQAAMMAAGARHGMRLVGPNCLGLFNARVGFYPIFSSSLESGWPVPGRVGIASQSGAYGTHMFAIARNRGIGTPVCVTTGNEGDVTVGDVIGWLAEDPETDVIAAYIEGFNQPVRLLEALSLARAARKPVIVMKVGTSAVGAHAARSHTASVAGDDAVADAVLAEFGAIRARSTEAMLDIAVTATRRIYPARTTLGVITISGGAGVLISDAAEALGVEMPEMPQAAQERLRAVVPYAAPRNPVDCTAQAFNDISLVGRFVDSMVEDGGYSAILGFFTQVGGSPSIGPGLRVQLRAVRERHPERLYVLCVVASPKMVRGYEEDGWVVFEDPGRAVAAIAAMGQLGAAFAAEPSRAPARSSDVVLPSAAPSEHEAMAVFEAAGIPGVARAVCTDAGAAVAAAARIGFPVVLKVLSPDILHKSEVGGVALGLADAEAVRGGFEALLERVRGHVPDARIKGVLVARMVRGGVECLMGVKVDPVFGPVAVVGLGGVFVEVLRDVAVRRCPFGPEVAEGMIRGLRGAPLLLGVRGRPACDIGALASALSALSVFAHRAGPRLVSAELNPVLALPEGCVALDALMELSD